MSGRRRRSKRMKTDPEDDEFERSFTVDEVKESMRTIGERFLKFIMEGVQSERRGKVREMASSVLQMRSFLISRKKRVEQSKSSRQLKQLETLSPLLDSANYLSSVAKDYLKKIEETGEQVRPQEQDEDNEHDSSFVDMFIDEPQANDGGKSEPQEQDTFTEEITQKTSQSLRETPSRSILKTTSSETPRIQKKISFAKKATKVYEDNQTSQISLAKSSGSVKSIDDYDPKAPNSKHATETDSDSGAIFGTQRSMQENSRQGSEDRFDDAESIVDTSFQGEMFSQEKPKNVKLFKAKHLIDFSQVKYKTDDGTDSTNQVNAPRNEPQEIEPDPLLSQESPNIKQNANESLKDQQTDGTLPFHNFVLTLPQDSSGSEDSLDARVNMAINLVNMKPREPEMELVLPGKVETPKNSTDGIVPSSVTCTDFRWLEPMEYNRETSQYSSLQEIQRDDEPKLPATIFEDAIASKNLLPPFDIQNENKIKIQATPFFSNQNQETGVHAHENHPQLSSSVFPPKPTWANPFQTSIPQFSSTHQAVQIKPVDPEPENSIKDKIQSLVISEHSGNVRGKESQQNKASTKKICLPKMGNIEKKAQPQPIQQQLNRSKPVNSSRQSQNVQAKRARGLLPKVSKLSQGTRRPTDAVNMHQETFDSHKGATTAKFETCQSFKQAFKNAVLTASVKQPAEEVQKQKPPDSKIFEESKEQPLSAAKIPQENNKIARMRCFGNLWNDPSSTTLPDTEIIPIRIQPNLKLHYATSTGKTRSIKRKELVNTKSPVKRKPRIKLKPSQEDSQTASSKEHQGKLDESKDKVRDYQNSTKVVSDKITKQEKVEGSNNETTSPGTKWADNTQNPPNNLNVFPSVTTPLPDTVLVDSAHGGTDRPENDTAGIIQINTSSMICETSFSGEKSSQGRRKQTNSSQKKNRSSQNDPKTVDQQPKAQFKLSQGNKPVTKRGRGRAKSGNGGNPAKKRETTTTTGLTSNSYFEPQPVGPFDYSLFSNVGSNVQNLHPPAQQGILSSKQGFHKAEQFLTSSDQDFQQVQSLSSKQESERTEPGFLRFQLHVPQTSLEPQPAKSQHSASESGHVFQTDWHQELTTTQPEGFSTFQQQPKTDPFTPTIDSSVNAATAGPSHAQCVSAQNEPWLHNLQKDGHVSISNNQEVDGGSFFEPQLEYKHDQFAQMFNEPSNEVNFGQKRQTIQSDWQPNPSLTSQYEPSYHNFPTAMDQQMCRPLLQMQPEPLIQASSVKFGQINNSEGRRDDISAEMQRTAEERVPIPTKVPSIEHRTEENPPERTSGSQTNKRAGKRGKQQPKSPKMMKIHENETQNKVTDNCLGTQGTEILYEECDKLSWASDDFPDAQMFDTQMINPEMFDTQMINTHIFNSQPLSQNADPPAVSRSFPTAGSEYKQAQGEFQREEDHQLSWGSTNEDRITGFQVPNTQDNYTGTKEMNTSSNFNEEYGNNSSRQQDPQHTEAVKNLSETNQSVSFTEFQRGVQATSTEQTENAKTPQNGRFKEPAKKTKAVITRKQRNCTPSIDSAGAEQTSASATLNKPYHQDPEHHSETIQNPENPDRPAYEFNRGFPESSTELAADKTTEPEKQKTEAEEIEELINTIEWIRQIPVSELIEAANIEELINDQTFVW